MTQSAAYSELVKTILEALSYPAPQTLWEWAEANIELTGKTGTFSAGPYRTRFTPHVRQVMEDYQNPDVKTIVLAWASQTSKTLTETICCAWAIANDPGNTLFVMPSETMAKSFSKSRLQRVMIDTPSVYLHVLPGRGKFNTLEMEMDNCIVALTGSNSASNLASRPVRRLFLDEVDKYPPALKEEGDPISLAEERTKTFLNACVMKSSTPTVETAPIWSSLCSSTRYEWRCPCPGCGAWFTPTWREMQFDADGSDDQRAESARVVCPSCGRRISEGERRAFVTAGRWEKDGDDGPSSVHGYRISELSSAIGRPWPELVKLFLDAARNAKAGNIERMRSFVCSVLAEPWRVETDTLRDAGEFRKYCDGYRRGTFPGFLPISGLTIGIDTQKSSYWYVIRAWGGGESMESWLVDYGEVTDLNALENVAFSVYLDDEGRAWRITSGFMDSGGDKTHEVYDWCRRVGRHAGIMPSKGEQKISGGQHIAVSHVEHDRLGRKVLGGLNLFRVNVTYFKDWLDQKLRVPADQAGAWHIFDDVTEEYARQMSSEYRNENGVWVTRGLKTPNHLWDCEVYALAAAANARFDRTRFGTSQDSSEENSVGGGGRWTRQ